VNSIEQQRIFVNFTIILQIQPVIGCDLTDWIGNLFFLRKLQFGGRKSINCPILVGDWQIWNRFVHFLADFSNFEQEYLFLSS
jgi:hypothetical protein